jgi:D-sedoheptulose 7-phosphate isomerase
MLKSREKELKLYIGTNILKNIRIQHTGEVLHGLNSIDQSSLQKAADIICEAIKDGRTIYTIGNGASASIAQHWACDYTKGCSNINNERPVKVKVVSLAANIPLMTAISNDVSYDEVYSYQIERICEPGDVLIAISSSGNSPNVVCAINAAIRESMNLITLTGFTGGVSMSLANNYERGVNVHVDCPEYEAAEDCHQAIMHMIAKYIRKFLQK